ncbi:uncharacterized protein [Antennarius striatus]|uniref:uncharacterized protein n=1 Tax=Antennarius striatus TaxID=241820 RepID=UPI0035B25EDD
MPAGASVSLLGAVLGSAEALLCRLTGEAWQNQDLSIPLYCHAGSSEARECEQQAGCTNLNTCYPQLLQVNLTKAEPLPHEPVHLQSTAPCLSDQDLSKIISISPLFKTLQNIQQSLHNLATTETYQHLLNAAPEESVQENNDGRLIPTTLDNLSPQYLAVYLFGCQVMQLLANHPVFPSVLLLLAKSIPVPSSSSNKPLLAHFSRDFYFDAVNQILYLSETKLQHVGHFTSTLLLSMASVASGSKPHSFMQTLYEAISALGLQLFNFYFKWNEAESKLNASGGQYGTLVEEFLNIRVPTEAQFTEPLLASRLKNYEFFKLEQLITNLKQSLRSREDSDSGLPPNGTPIQMACVEEEIDRMNESFLQLSVRLQNRAQISKLKQERENSAGDCSVRASPKDMPSLSRNGTLLLELKRRYVSQRLNELQIMLGHIKQCQQHDSESKDGTRGSTQMNNSPTQQGKMECDPA